MKQRHVDVIIVGAGLSGVSVASHLAEESSGRTYVILERRTRIGGTWDLFRYPGIRSDSDMFTFGYRFRAWQGTEILADGSSIRRYIQETADAYGITDHIRFGRKVARASWSSEAGLWTVEAFDEKTGESEVHTSKFLVNATGYYNYDAGHRPTFPGEECFGGTVIHPQHWPEDLNYRGKRVVVIGSGATAMSLVPAMAGDAAHVTMLQRSPTYIMTLPRHDQVGIPPRVVHRFARARYIAMQRGLFTLCRSAPGAMRKLLLAGVRAQLGPKIDMRHFTPSYKPWDQRLCVVPGGDLFTVLKSGAASVATGHIDSFTKSGIRLKSGEEIPADVIVTATGLQVQLAGGAELEVDGRTIDTRDHVLYKGVMLDGIPNLAVILGYTNASWTLKADMAAEYVNKLLTYMDSNGYTQVTAVASDADRAGESAMGDALSSGYVQRGDAGMPRQGTRAPWKNFNNYYRDRRALRRAPIEDTVLRFGSSIPATASVNPQASSRAA
jgi:cation diffusion facilitator CzcD-associated flavoprotein CzcO